MALVIRNLGCSGTEAFLLQDSFVGLAKRDEALTGKVMRTDAAESGTDDAAIHILCHLHAAIGVIE